MSEPVEIDIRPDPAKTSIAVRKAEAYRLMRLRRNSALQGGPGEGDLVQALLQLVVAADELAVAVLNEKAAERLDAGR